MNNKDAVYPDWIALEWSPARAIGWAMRDGAVIATAQSEHNEETLMRESFEAAITRHLEGWHVTPHTPVIVCGAVVPAANGIALPCRPVPCQPLGETLARFPSERFDVRIVPGLRQDTPPGITSGEETRIAGFLAMNEGWDGVICLPGPQTSWAQVSAGEVVSFQTFMTGELFTLLRDRSALRASVNSDETDPDAFAEALNDTMSRPERLAVKLSAIRADDLLHATPSRTGRARLTGALIGAELAAARPYWLGMNVAVIGTDGMAPDYVEALQSQGVPVTVAERDAMTRAGLLAAYRLGAVGS